MYKRAYMGMILTRLVVIVRYNRVYRGFSTADELMVFRKVSPAI